MLFRSVSQSRYAISYPFPLPFPDPLPPYHIRYIILYYQIACYRLYIAIHGLLQSIIILSLYYPSYILIHTAPSLQILPPLYRTYVRYRIYSTHKQKFHTDNINPKPLLKKSQIRIQIHIVSHSSNHPSHLHSPNTIPLPQNKNPTIFITKLQQNPSKNTPIPLSPYLTPYLPPYHHFYTQIPL